MRSSETQENKHYITSEIPIKILISTEKSTKEMHLFSSSQFLFQAEYGINVRRAISKVAGVFIVAQNAFGNKI